MITERDEDRIIDCGWCGWPHPASHDCGCAPCRSCDSHHDGECQ